MTDQKDPTYAGLVARLRGRRLDERSPVDCMEDAADALEAQGNEIERLKMLLREARTQVSEYDENNDFTRRIDAALKTDGGEA